MRTITIKRKDLTSKTIPPSHPHPPSPSPSIYSHYLHVFILLQEAFDSVKITMQPLRETDDQRRVITKTPIRRISLLLFHTNIHSAARKNDLSHHASLD